MADGPIAYWRMDTANGKSTIDDHGSLNLPLTLSSSGVTRGYPSALESEPDPALGFDGVTGVATLTANASTPLAFASENDHWTIEAWAKRDDLDAGTGSFRYVVDYSYGNANARAGYIFYYDVNLDQMAFEYCDGSACIRILATVGHAPLGEWHMWSIVKAGPEIDIYRDGAFENKGVTPTAMGARPSASFVIGDEEGASGHHWPGGLDEIAIFDKALDASALGKHFAASGR